MTANAERGEHELVLAGVTYPLRPSFTAIVAMEKKTERSLLQLAQDASIGTMTLTNVGVVASELIRAGATDDLNRRVSAEQIATLVYEDGLPLVLATLAMCLISAANGGRDRSGEARAPAAVPETGKVAGAE